MLSIVLVFSLNKQDFAAQDRYLFPCENLLKKLFIAGWFSRVDLSFVDGPFFLLVDLDRPDALAPPSTPVGKVNHLALTMNLS